MAGLTPRQLDRAAGLLVELGQATLQAHADCLRVSLVAVEQETP
jgi:hypothetical protein